MIEVLHYMLCSLLSVRAVMTLLGEGFFFLLHTCVRPERPVEALELYSVF